MFAPAFCLVWVVKRQRDVGRPAPRPPLRLAAMRSLAVCRCRGRRPRRPAEVSGGGRYAGGMNFSPTGYLLAGVGRKVAEGSRPLPTMQKINRWQWQGCGPGMPGPYGLLFPATGVRGRLAAHNERRQFAAQPRTASKQRQFSLPSFLLLPKESGLPGGCRLLSQHTPHNLRRLDKILRLIQPDSVLVLGQHVQL